MTAGQPLLEISRASKSYDQIPALQDVRLTLLRGEVHALMGENGAGKSTLIKLLAGVLPADMLELRVRGQPASIRSPADAHRLGLRFTHQELNVVPSLSVAENIFLGRPYPTLPFGAVNWSALRRRARTTLGHIGVSHLEPTQRMGQLSPGDAMLASIARAFVEEAHEKEAQHSRIYVMDEPTAALSRAENELLFKVIRRLTAKGFGVLYVSHRMEEIFEITDRVTVMRDGRVVATTLTREATPAALIRQMTGRSLATAYPPKGQSQSKEPALELEHLQNAKVRVDGLRVRVGEIVGIAGLAGSGRSELLRAIAGCDPVTTSRITLSGQPVRLRTSTSAWQNGVTYLPEERRSQGLVMGGSVRENIVLPHLARLSRYGMTDRRRERRFSERLGQDVKLKARSTEQIVRYLSGGNQQKIVLAKALAGNPRVLLLDEPTRGVDVGAKYDIYSLIVEAAAKGTVVLMVSSDLPELLGLTDRILVMQDGQLTHDTPTETLDQETLLTLCYGEEAP